MKAVFKNVYVMVIAVMLMVVMSACPVKAATSGTSTAGGYSCPAVLTIPVGSTQTLQVKEPAGTFSLGYVQYNSQYVQASNYCSGTRGGSKNPQITFKGIKPGSFTGYFTVTSFKTKTGWTPTGVYRLTYKVNVVSNTPAVKNIPLTKIALNETSQTLTAGDTMSLAVTYTPSNTTDNKKVTWSSSNSKVASVSGGKVTAKAAGTATITAKVGTKTAVCKVQVKAKAKSKAQSKESYKNVTEAYKLLNTFRTTKANQWYWNPSNTRRIRTYGLKALKRDKTLEKVAKQRAKEQWIQYYQYGKDTHTRPNGKSMETAYPAGMGIIGENLHWGSASARIVVLDPNNGWAETNKKYKNQGHRRLMLNSAFTKVGIACYEKDGKYCWAMCLSN